MKVSQRHELSERVLWPFVVDISSQTCCQTFSLHSLHFFYKHYCPRRAFLNLVKFRGEIQQSLSLNPHRGFVFTLKVLHHAI